jgi:hypothetical protein
MYLLPVNLYHCDLIRAAHRNHIYGLYGVPVWLSVTVPSALDNDVETAVLYTGLWAVQTIQIQHSDGCHPY